MSLPTIPPASGSAAPPELDTEDMLDGGGEIHVFWTEYRKKPQSKSATYDQLSKGVIPARRLGHRWIASKRGIRQALAIGTGLVGALVFVCVSYGTNVFDLVEHMPGVWGLG